jgi:hypothetical protein
MNMKQMVFGLLVSAVLMLNIPGAVIAEEDAQYEASNITIQLGSDEKELNFTWFTTDASASCELAIFKMDKGKGEMFHKKDENGKFRKHAEIYAGTVEAVDSETYACKVTGVEVKGDMEYAYAVGNGSGFSDIYYIKANDPEKGFNFIFVGDPQIGASRDADSDAAGWEDCIAAALSKFEDADFILSSGDQVESSTSDTQYDGFFGKYVKTDDDEAQQQNRFLTAIPFAPAIGNHDTSELYAYHFNVPNESDLGQSTDRSGEPDGAGGDYWFTYDNTLFMVLNTNNDSALEHSEFMTEAIGTNPKALWKVVVFHHSLYSSASHITDVNTLRLNMAPVMDDHDIDVVLAGHDHFYARTYQLVGGEEDQACVTTSQEDPRTGETVEKETCVDLIDEVVPEELLTYNKEGAVVDPLGTVYFTANSASGSKFYNFNNIEGYTNYYLAEYDESKTASYLNVEVKGETLTVSAYSVEDGEMIDTYSIHKIAGMHHGQHEEHDCQHNN